MNSIQIVVLIVSCYINLIQAGSLPEFITPCKGTEPNLNECAVREANNVIPHFIKGDKRFNIPVLAPLKIDQIKVENIGKLNIVIKDAVVRGLEDTKALKFNINLKSHRIQLRINIPNLNIQGQYEMSGQVLVLPISGKGPCNITAVNGDYDLDMSYSVYDQGGVEYAKLETCDVQIDIKGAHLNFANLLNSKRVSDDVNVLLNKEWRQVFKDLDPAIKETVKTIVKQVVNGILQKVSYTEMWGLPHKH